MKRLLVALAAVLCVLITTERAEAPLAHQPVDIIKAAAQAIAAVARR